MALGGFVLGSPIIFLKGMRRMMFQLSGFYYREFGGLLVGSWDRACRVISVLVGIVTVPFYSLTY